jgi:hypothetical protein
MDTNVGTMLKVLDSQQKMKQILVDPTQFVEPGIFKLSRLYSRRCTAIMRQNRLE